MRIPDTFLYSSFLNTYNKSKSSLAQIQYQMSTQSKVNKPSDNPLSSARILGLEGQLTSIDSYKSNISYAKSMVNSSILSMEAMAEQITNIKVKMTEVNSNLSGDDLKVYAESIDASLEVLLELANSDFNGQYNFSGTETGTKPFYYDEVNNKVVTNVKHLGGDRVANIASNITQKYNISGKDLFQSVYSQSGNFDSNAAVGDVIAKSTQVYGADGQEYSLDLSYTKTADNTYKLNYIITDSESNVIENSTVNNIKFNAETGKFDSIDGDKFGEIHVQNSNNKLDFVIDLNKIHESDSPAKLKGSLNQKTDIFNTLISMRDSLANGEKPNETQLQIVNDFHDHLLNINSTAGGIANKLDSSESVLSNREIDFLQLLSDEKDVDMARAILDLQSAQYTLDVSYKISSMLLPQSLLDYL